MVDKKLSENDILYHANMNGLIDYMSYDTPYPYYYVPQEITPDMIYKFADDILKAQNER
jgi:hypothetical protein